MKIMLTGFKPFLGQAINPSEKIVQEFSDLESLILPVEFGKSFVLLRSAILQKPPDFLILIGQAGGRKNICFEKIGLNWLQTEHADENGITPVSGPILKSSPLALMSSFPIDAAYTHLKQQQFPVEISFSAGTYVCNELYYQVLNEFPQIKTVFIHVPYLPEQVGGGDSKASLSLEIQVRVFRALHIWLSEQR